MHERFNLRDKHVLEFGCFESMHTIGLSMYAKAVTAIDARIENVVKTMTRSAFFGYSPTFFTCNVEAAMVGLASVAADVACHIGVLYQRKNPVRHLLILSTIIREGVLDRHYASE